jgi:NDP-sugar pyrophosphorylase family protein
MNTLNHTSAIVLAGGLGTRLRSVVADRPKALAEVCGRPFLAHLLDQLEQAGICHVVLCVGHRAEQIQETFGGAYRGIRLAYSVEQSLQGTGGAIRDALPQTASDPVFALNGDSYCQADFAALWNWRRERNAPAAMLLRWVDDPARYGRVDIDPQGTVKAFAEKSDEAPPGWINAGVYVLSRAVIEAIPSGRPVSIEREVFPKWVGKGLVGCPQGGRFIDIGTPESYAEAEEFFAARAAG